MRLSAEAAFDICQEVFAAAREVVDNRMATMQLTTASKFLWRTDLHPRLVEYVADFKLAGKAALADQRDKKRTKHPFAPTKPPRASRLILFNLYYVGGAEYQRARRLLGLSELTWSDWTGEIRKRVGHELIRRGMFPPSRYFKQPSR